MANKGRVERERRNKEAQERTQARATRTPAQQLALLDEKFGKGVGAKKERARLGTA